MNKTIITHSIKRNKAPVTTKQPPTTWLKPETSEMLNSLRSLAYWRNTKRQAQRGEDVREVVEEVER